MRVWVLDTNFNLFEERWRGHSDCEAELLKIIPTPMNSPGDCDNLVLPEHGIHMLYSCDRSFGPPNLAATRILLDRGLYDPPVLGAVVHGIVVFHQYTNDRYRSLDSRQLASNWHRLFCRNPPYMTLAQQLIEAANCGVTRVDYTYEQIAAQFIQERYNPMSRPQKYRIATTVTGSKMYIEHAEQWNTLNDYQRYTWYQKKSLS